MKILTSSLLIAFALVFVMPSTMAVVDIYKFDTESQRQRYHTLIDELRCPKCQNQNLAGSDSQIAADLRRELHRLLLEGKTDQEIKTFMVDRYGDFVLYKPRLQKSTAVLWGLPLLLLIIGIGVVSYIVRGRAAHAKSQVQGLSASEEGQLGQLLSTSAENNQERKEIKAKGE